MTKGRNKKAAVSPVHEPRKNGISLKGEKSKETQKKSISSSKHSAPMAEGKAQKRPSKSSKSHANGSSTQKNSSLKKKLLDKEEREKIVLWRRPIQTIHYFIRETISLLVEYIFKLCNHKLLVALSAVILCLLYVGNTAPGPHQEYLRKFEKEFLWAGWWIWLGVLSSVGLGTGLHTFLLYLGPHIASVTMAAYSCGSVNFPSPPYPDEIVCSDDKDSVGPITIWTIMAKVRWEAFYWGAGTALGELPPYFMARSARLSGIDPDDEELQEFEELQRLKERPEEMSFIDRLKLSMERFVEKVGFFGILACASIPNPLFDLAGITCGHFLVPFWKFFGATLIGKAVIKMHIQQIFVIIAFNESLLDSALLLLAKVPVVGAKLQKPFGEFLQNQKMKFKGKEMAHAANEGGNMLGWIFEKFIVVMILYFVVSLVNSFAQNYHKRLHKQNASKQRKD